MNRIPTLSLAAIAGTLLVAAVPSAEAQLAFGFTTSNNTTASLFSFNVTSPGTANLIGVANSITFVPEGIDFSPHNGLLYAIDIGAVTSQLYTLSITTGVATPIGAGFQSVVAGSYDLGVGSNGTGTGANYGFDVNPKTVQGDGSIRIRLISSDGDNLRLNSATGLVSNVDPVLNGGAANAIGAAYTNNFAQLASQGAGTTLFDVSTAGTDGLYTQNVTTAALTLVAPLGGALSVGLSDTAGFDVFTAAGGSANTAYVVSNSTATAGNELQTLDLSTGVATLVGGTGTIGANLVLLDIAVQPLPVPEPATATLAVLGLVGLAARRRRTA